MTRANVLIIAGDSEFASQVMSRWRAARDVPSFTLISNELWNSSLRNVLYGETRAEAYDLVLVGPLAERQSATLLKQIETIPAPAVHVTRDAALVRAQGTAGSRLLLVPARDGWLDELILLSTEVLRRVEAVRGARRAEHAAALSAQPAALGRYMLDVRPRITNALTSLLGNAELILAESHGLPESALPRVETIQAMTLRLSEIMQRFSSLASELRADEKHSQDETEELFDAVAAVPDAT